MASAVYNISNQTGAYVLLSDDEGDLYTIGPGGATLSLSASGFQKAVRAFGATNVKISSGSVNSPYVFTALGDQTVPITSSVAVPLSPPSGATMALIQVAGDSIRYRDDGVAPTSTVGTEVLPGASFQLSVQSFASVQFIAENTAATLTINYFK